MAQYKKKGIIIQEEMKNIKISYEKLIGFCIFIIATLPIIIASGYSVLSADDFSMMLQMKPYVNNNILKSAVAMTIEFYKRWGGSYSVIFVEYIMSPFILSNFEIVKLFLILMNILFFVSVYYFVKQYSEYIKAEDAKFWAYVMGMVSLCGYYCYTEIFYWFVGNVACCLSLIYFFFGTSFLLKAYVSGKKKYWLLTYIFMILMGGSYLQVSIPSWVFVLGINVIWKCVDKKYSKGGIVAFLILSIATFLGGIAPGNMTRHEAKYGEGLNIVNAGFYSVKVTIQELLRVLENPLFLAAIIVMIYIGIKTNKRKVDRKLLAVEIICSFLFICVVCFPVLLGYSGKGIDAFANRGLFILDISTYLIGIFISYELGGFLACNRVSGIEKIIMVFGVALASFFVIRQDILIEDSALYMTWEQVLDGSISEYSSQVYEIYDQIECSSENNIVLYDYPQVPSSFRGCYITDKSEHWINIAVSGVFDKESIIVK